MQSALTVRLTGEWNPADAVDRVVLDADGRHCRRRMLTGERGLSFLLNLRHATVLREGDGLVLEDGAIVQVAGRPEPLLEIAAATPNDLARLAWHIGNRHAELQIVGATLHIRRDHVLEEMLCGLGARITPIEGVFDPESGAYAPDHRHDHGHRD